MDIKLFIDTYVGNLSFYHTQDFAITVLLHHIETSGTELFRNMSFYSVIIVVLCLLCISDLYLTLPVCLDKKTSFKPQLPSVSLILPQLRKKTGSSPVPLQRRRHTHLLYTHGLVCVLMYNTDKRGVFQPTWQQASLTPEENVTLSVQLKASVSDVKQ